MWLYVLRRLLVAIPVLFGITLVSFFSVRLVPGDTVTALLGANYSEAQATALRAQYGLDQPLYTQYIIWMKNVLQGDLGYSTFTNQPVVEVIVERLPVTLQLALLAVILALVIAIPLGTLAAVRKNSAFDYGASFLGMFGLSIPNFWLGTILILVLSLTFGWLPSGGFVPFFVDPIANLKSMIMPSLALGTAVAAVVLRMTRSSMLEVLSAEYVKMARAKGVSERRLIFKHALKNAFVPIITVIGIQVGYMMGGSVVIEQIFSLPGIGRLALQAINNRDYALLQGTILFIAMAFVLINLVVDLIYAYVNPKIRFD